MNEPWYTCSTSYRSFAHAQNSQSDLLRSVELEGLSRHEIDVVASVLRDIACSLLYMHDREIVHGAISPQAIVRVGVKYVISGASFMNAGKSGEAMDEIVVTGHTPPELAAIASRFPRKANSSGGLRSRKKSKLKNGHEHAIHDKRTDIWAFGTLMWLLGTERYLFHTSLSTSMIDLGSSEHRR